MFRAFGHDNSSVLNGGLLRWISEGYPIDQSAPSEVQATKYPIPQLDEKVLRGMWPQWIISLLPTQLCNRL
jgi:thiosulfate/3-mercaptopyruvate sulfurtransferase